MEKEVAQKIIGELLKFSPNRYAVTSVFGEILAATDNFRVNHNPLEIKSSKAFELNCIGKKMGYVFVDENPEKAKEIGELVKSMSELILTQQYYKEILSHDERKLDQLIYTLLKTEVRRTSEVAQSLKYLNLSLNEYRTAILIEFENKNFLLFDQSDTLLGEREAKIARVKRQLDFLFKSLYPHHTNNIISYLGGSDFVILKGMGKKPLEYQKDFRKTVNGLFFNLKNELRAEISMGIGTARKGHKETKESYEEALTALRFGKQNWGKGNVYHYDSFGVIAPLFSGVTEENIQVTSNLIHKLKKTPILFKTLVTFFDSDASLGKTSKKLNIHRNTLVYRLERITELTGLDPKKFNDAFELQMAIVVDKYSEVKDE